MRLHTEGNAHYLRFAETPVIESEEVRPGIVFDFDANGRIVAIEILAIYEPSMSGIVSTAPDSA